jgi:hypothetical protein
MQFLQNCPKLEGERSKVDSRTYRLFFAALDTSSTAGCKIILAQPQTQVIFSMDSLRQPVLVRLFAADLLVTFADWSEPFGESLPSDLTSSSASSASVFGAIVGWTHMSCEAPRKTARTGALCSVWAYQEQGRRPD